MKVKRYFSFGWILLLTTSLLFVMSSGVVRAEPETQGDSSSAAADIRKWATQPGDGENGRPLPLTGSWNIGRYYQTPWKKGEDYTKPQAWDPTYFTELIEQGHHVLPTFPDPMTRSEKPGDNFGLLSVKFVPPLKYCAKHNLPFAFRDWNWADKIAQFEGKGDQEFPNEKSARFIKNGEQKGRKVSPLGAIERWREFGRSWGGNGFARAMAEIYPDPPLIVYLNNNEAGEIGVNALNNKATRFVEKYGKDVSTSRKREILHRGYRKRYRATFEAARKAAPADWDEAMTFVAYNAFPWPKPRGVTPLQVKQEQLPERFHEWSYFDGAMPENYMNDWQVGRGKTDFSSWSPQVEATTYNPLTRAVLESHPNYYFASIGWEGGPPAKRGSPANTYAVGDFGGGPVKKWDIDRYMGMLQFGLWAMRPRVFREFRGGGTRDAYYQRTWETYLRIVDRVWERERLQPFWKHGKLVENPDIRWQPGNADRMQLERWYLLHSDENPPPSDWPQIWKRETTKLRVFALALKLGKKPERRWLVYAHAPLGAVRNAHVTLPGYGELTLNTVSRRGSFYIVNEKADSVQQVIKGGPPRINLSTSRRFAPSGSDVVLQGEVTCPPDASLIGFRWSHNQKEVHRSDQLDDQAITLDENGKHTFQVTGITEDGTKVTGETTVWVGDEPSESVVYDVPLDGASTWSGPWRAVGKEFPGRLQRYRLVPNRGRATDPVLHGGEFVKDPEQERVLSVGRGREGLWGERSGQTVNRKKGHPNKTISFRFRAAEVKQRQVLYSEGHANAGFNIYLDDGTLYAGGWGVKEKFGSWDGNWISTGAIQPKEWYHVALVLKNGKSKVTPNRLRLYLNGKKVASGAGKRLPRHHSGPRLGVAATTRFHDDKTGRNNGRFEGRFADFRLLLKASAPDGK